MDDTPLPGAPASFSNSTMTRHANATSGTTARKEAGRAGMQLS